MKILTFLSVFILLIIYGVPLQAQEQSDTAKIPAMTVEQITKKYEQIVDQYYDDIEARIKLNDAIETSRFLGLVFS